VKVVVRDARSEGACPAASLRTTIFTTGVACLPAVVKIVVQDGPGSAQDELVVAGAEGRPATREAADRHEGAAGPAVYAADGAAARAQGTLAIRPCSSDW